MYIVVGVFVQSRENMPGYKREVQAGESQQREIISDAPGLCNVP